MHRETTGILLAALFVVPTCLGLWRGDDAPWSQDGGMMKRLLERRSAQRRLGKPAKENRSVNYYFLGIVAPTEPGTELNEGAYDRRVRGRRAEDAVHGTKVIEARNPDPMKPWPLEAAALQAAARRSAGEADRLRGGNDAP